MHGHGARSYAEPTMDTTAPSSGGNEVAEMAELAAPTRAVQIASHFRTGRWYGALLTSQDVVRRDSDLKNRGSVVKTSVGQGFSLASQA